MRQSAVYIMANKRNGTLYTGVTSNLVRRVFEHKNNLTSGFASRYGCKLLVFYTLFNRVTDAINAEKIIKTKSRLKKLELIESTNPEWEDLYEYICSL